MSGPAGEAAPVRCRCGFAARVRPECRGHRFFCPACGTELDLRGERKGGGWAGAMARAAVPGVPLVLVCLACRFLLMDGEREPASGTAPSAATAPATAPKPDPLKPYRKPSSADPALSRAREQVLRRCLVSRAPGAAADLRFLFMLDNENFLAPPEAREGERNVSLLAGHSDRSVSFHRLGCCRQDPEFAQWTFAHPSHVMEAVTDPVCRVDPEALAAAFPAEGDLYLFPDLCDVVVLPARLFKPGTNPFGREIRVADAGLLRSFPPGSPVLAPDGEVVGLLSGQGDKRWILVAGEVAKLAAGWEGSGAAMRQGWGPPRKRRYTASSTPATDPLTFRNGPPAPSLRIANQMVLAKGRVYAMFLADKEIVSVDPARPEDRKSLRVTGVLADFSVDEQAGELLVFQRANPLLFRHDLDTLALKDTVPLGRDPAHGHHLGAGRYVYGDGRTGELVVGSLDGKFPERVIGENQGSLLLDAPRQRLYVADAPRWYSLHVYDVKPQVPVEIRGGAFDSSIGPAGTVHGLGWNLALSPGGSFLTLGGLLLDPEDPFKPLLVLPDDDRFVAVVDERGLALTLRGFYNLTTRARLLPGVNLGHESYTGDRPACVDPATRTLYAHNHYTGRLDAYRLEP